MSDTSGTTPPAENPGDLRKKLDAALESNRKLTVENTLHRAGLSHLNEAQQHALTITLPKGTEINAETLKGQATALGFPLEVTPPAPPAPPPGDPATPPAPGDPVPTDPNMPPVPTTNFLTPFPGSAHPDPRVVAAAAGVTEQEYAHVVALRAQAGFPVGGDSLDKAMSQAKTKEEAVAALRQHGSSAGILLDSDLE